MQADDVNGVDIELRDLRLPLVTSQHRSLRKAAEARNIRQPTLSRRLHEIEYQLGVVGLGSGRCHAIPDKSHAIKALSHELVAASRGVRRWALQPKVTILFVMRISTRTQG
jgi:hypothetical protein